MNGEEEGHRWPSEFDDQDPVGPVVDDRHPLEGDVVDLWFNTASYAGGIELEPEPDWMSAMMPGERVRVRIVRMPTTQQHEEA